MTRHMFAGASTPIGFINFFDHIMPIETAKKRYFLKGSSGSGKSTFLKKIAAEFESAGFHTEQFHCANDADSLDAVSVGSQGLCIIDATAPHARDPEIPIAVDKMIDFSKFIDEKKILSHVDEIKSLLRSKRLLQEKASGYFSAVGSVYLAEKAALETAMIKHASKKLARECMNLIGARNMTNYEGADRKLFLSAVTPDGYVSFAEDLSIGCKVYGICARAGAGADIFLGELRDQANAHGIQTESFYCPFAPDRLEYLHLPEMETIFAVTDGHFGYNGKTDEIIELGTGTGTSNLSPRARTCVFDGLLESTVNLMNASRTLHMRIEDIYVNTIDFKKINKLTEKIMRELIVSH